MDDMVAVPTVPRPTAQRPRAMIGMPWYKSSNPVTAFSVMGLVDRTRTALLLNHGDAFVAHTRNHVADNFLKSGFEWLLTIDDDMVVPFGNGNWFNAFTGFNLPMKFANLHTLDRLLSHGKKLIGGLYKGRTVGGKYMFAEGLQNAEVAKYLDRGPHDEIRPCRWVGTGCMLIHRDVFLDIEARFPVLSRAKNGGSGHWFTSSEHSLKNSVAELCKELESAVAEKRDATFDAWSKLSKALAVANNSSSLGTGEDVIFCIRAAAAGHQPFVDLGLLCGHVGTKVYGR